MSGSLMRPFHPTVVRGFSLVNVRLVNVGSVGNKQVSPHDYVEVWELGDETSEKSRVFHGLFG